MHTYTHTNRVGYDQECIAHQALPLSCQRNHVLSHSANTASAQRRRKQDSSCHLFASPPVQTSKPPQRLVIKSLGFAVLRLEIKPLSLFCPCLYLDKQMTTCSEPVQRLNKGARGVELIFQTEHRADGLVLTCQFTWTDRRKQTHMGTK